LGCQSLRKQGTNRWFWCLPEPATVSIHGSVDELDQVAQDLPNEQPEQLDFDHEK
jgi:hypothetical protein